jgi:hypothetical protein
MIFCLVGFWNLGRDCLWWMKRFPRKGVELWSEDVSKISNDRFNELGTLKIGNYAYGNRLASFWHSILSCTGFECLLPTSKRNARRN